jgi:hypothetical protein
VSIIRAVKQVLWCVKEIANAEWRVHKPFDWSAKRKKWEGYVLPDGREVAIVPTSYDDLVSIMSEPDAELRSLVEDVHGEVFSVKHVGWPDKGIEKYLLNFGTWHMSVEDRWQHNMRGPLVTFVTSKT